MKASRRLIGSAIWTVEPIFPNDLTTFSFDKTVITNEKKKKPRERR